MPSILKESASMADPNDLARNFSILKQRSSFNLGANDENRDQNNVSSSWGGHVSKPSFAELPPDRRRGVQSGADVLDGSVNMVVEGSLIMMKSFDVPGALTSPGRKQMDRARQERCAVLKTFETPPHDHSSPVKCRHIGALAIALTYALRQAAPPTYQEATASAEERRQYQVTPEDIFFSTHLPLHYMTKSAITLDELYSIARTFLATDSRFTSASPEVNFVVEIVHMDTVLKNGNEVVSDELFNEIGDRGPRQSMADVRRMLHDELAQTDAIYVVNYDTDVVEAALEREEDEEKDESSTNHNGPSKLKISPSMRKIKDSHDKATRAKYGSYAIVTDFHPALNNVVLGTISIDTEMHLEHTEIPLSAFCHAMCSKNDYNGRARGYLKVYNKASVVNRLSASLSTGGVGGSVEVATLMDSLAVCAMDEDQAVVVPCMFSRELCSGVVIGSTNEGVPFSVISGEISPHLVGAAFALHLIHGKRNGKYGRGMCVSDIVRTLRLPLDTIVHHDLSIEHVYQYLSQYLAIKQMNQELDIEFRPVLQKVRREDAATSMSISELIKALDLLRKNNCDRNSPNTVILVNFNAGVAHNILNLPNQSHWAIITGFDGEDNVLMHDCLPRKFSSSWTLKVDRLHKAVIHHGFLVLRRRNLPESVTPFTFGEPDPTVCERLKSLPILPSAEARNISALIYHRSSAQQGISIVSPLTAVCLALTQLGKTASVSSFLHSLTAFDVNALLSRRLAMHDLCRIVDRYTGRKSLASRAVHLERNRERLSVAHFIDTVKGLVSDPTNRAMIAYFDRSLLTSAPKNGGDFALVHTISSDTKYVTITDCNPNTYMATWRVATADLFEACTAPCNVTLRRRGYLALESITAKAGQFLEERQKRTFDYASVPTAHQFRPASVLTVSTLSFALTHLRLYHSPEEIFYASQLSSLGETTTLHEGQAVAWKDIRTTLYELNEGISPSQLEKVGTCFLKSIKKTDCLRVERVPIAVEGTSRDAVRDQVAQLVHQATESTCTFLLVAVYNIEAVHGERIHTMPAGAVLVSGFEKDMVTATECDPSHFGPCWTRSLDEFLVACGILAKEPVSSGCDSNDVSQNSDQDLTASGYRFQSHVEYGLVKIGLW